MRIFALETDEKKLIQSFLSEGEVIMLEVKFSPFLFVMRSVLAFLYTVPFIVLGAVAFSLDLPLHWVTLVLVVPWLAFVVLRWLTALIDWLYDLIVITSDEIIIIDQSSLFHRNVRQFNLDNVASVSAETQFLNLLPFGRIHFDLKEGSGKPITLSYIPDAQDVASKISDAVVKFQRQRPAAKTAKIGAADD